MPRAKSSNSWLGGVAAIIAALGGGSGILLLLGGAKSDQALIKSQRHSTSYVGVEQQPTEPIEQPVEFTLYDRLGRNQVSKYLSVALDGKPAGALTLDEAHPSGTLKLTVPRAGAHSYALEGVLTVRGFFGGQQQLRGHGRAAIDVAPGQTFEPRVTVKGNTAHFSLQPASGAAE